jgi:glutaryl-CoA dehydrogenase
VSLRSPEANRLPGARSFKDTARVLAGTRNSVAWAALGHATAGYEIALSYCRQRQQVGQPLVGFQIVQQRLVKMLAEVCLDAVDLPAVGSVAERGRADRHDRRDRQDEQHQPSPLGTRRGARDLLGGNRIQLDYHVIRHMADIEAIHTYEGTETIQTLIVGRDITGVSAFA